MADQPNGITIEQVLNETLSSLLGEEITVTGASRTDAGVHSLAMLLFLKPIQNAGGEDLFCTQSAPAGRYRGAGVLQVPEDFHPRFSKSRKTYEYRILNCRFRQPLREGQVIFITIRWMSVPCKGAAYLVGNMTLLPLRPCMRRPILMCA